MMNTAIARRYARALLNATLEAAEPEQAEATATMLETLAAAVADHAGLRRVLASPAIDSRKKAAVLVDLAGRLGAGSLAQRFLRLLAERERLDHLQAIAAAYRALVDEDAGVVNAEVVAPQPLQADDIALLQERLSASTGRSVRLTTRSDPGLLGGLVTRIGDVIYDGSLRHQLDRIRNQMVNS